MSSRDTEIDHARASDFEELACPTPRGLAASLTLLRRNIEPFSAQALADRRDLLFLPFLRGIATEEARIDRLKAALALAADRLPGHYELVYRTIFLEPPGAENLSDRRDLTLTALKKRYPSKVDNETTAVKGIEDRLIPALVKVLLDPTFVEEVDDELPLLDTHRVSSGVQHAFQCLYAKVSFAIQEVDYRKGKLHRWMKLSALVPDQRVATLRYHTQASNPFPVPDSVKMLSAGHTYLTTVAESHAGAIGDWMLDFIYLGERKEPGDTVDIEMAEEIFDEARHDDEPCVTMTVDHASVQKIDLELLLPSAKRDMSAERAVIRSPHSNSVKVSSERLTVDKDGWFRTQFTEVKEGHQYGIYLPGFSLYS